MTPQQIDKLEINALALRKIADTVLEQVQALKAGTTAPGRKRKKIDRVADIKARILAGRIKPTKSVSAKSS